jgi:hypothetical protein
MAAVMMSSAMDEPEPGPADQSTYHAMRAALGIGGPQ